MQESDMYGGLLPVESGVGSLSEKERLMQIVRPLVDWFRAGHRDLPWRADPSPYHIWISEIMLQQTRVEAVIPYYNRFLEKLPDIPALASVDDEELMKLWQGLGYYNRAKNLKAAAIRAVEAYHGNLPGDYIKLLDLPGIGSYTAGAISSIAFGLPYPAVDGNVLRVISRVLASEEDIGQTRIKRKMEEDLKEIMPESCPGDFNQALMELGAMVCIPNGEPHCTECPLAGICMAHRLEKTDRIPYKAPKKPRRTENRTILMIQYQDSYVLQKRPPKGLLANLYEFPNVKGTLSADDITEWMITHGEPSFTAESITESVHIFSHVEWRMTAYRIHLKKIKGNQLHFYDRKEILEQYAVPSAYSAYLKILKDG